MPRDRVLSAMSAISLTAIRDVDGMTVAGCLQLLSHLQAAPETPLIEEAVEFIIRHPSMPPHMAAQLLQSLTVLRCPDLHRVVSAMRDSGVLQATSLAFSPSIISVFYAACVVAEAQSPDARTAGILISLRSSLAAGVHNLTLSDMLVIHQATLWCSSPIESSPAATLNASLWEHVRSSDLQALSMMEVISLAQCTLHISLADVRSTLLDKIFRRIERDMSSATLSSQELVAILEFFEDTRRETGTDERLTTLQSTALQLVLLRGQSDDTAAVVLLNVSCCEVFARDKCVTRLRDAVPVFILEAVVRHIEMFDPSAWTSLTVRTILPLLQRDLEFQPLALQLSKGHYAFIQGKLQSSTRLQPLDFTCLFVAGIVDDMGPLLSDAITAHLDVWSVAQVLSFLRHIAPLPGKTGRGVMRSAAATLTKYVDLASASQLTALMRCFGDAGVRCDPFCTAVVERLQQLQDSLSLTQWADVLYSFSVVELRSTKPFADAAPQIISLLGKGDGTPAVVSRIMAAYSKMLVWNFPVFWALANTMSGFAKDELSLREAVTAQLALIRMDLDHPRLTGVVLARIQDVFTSPDKPHNALSMSELITVLSVLSRTPVVVGGGEAGADMISVCTNLADRLVECADALDARAVAEILLSLTRIHLSDHILFEKLSLRTLGLLPSAQPLVMSYIIAAYAKAGRSDAEVFSLVAERTIQLKDRIAAVTIASVLDSFASAGVSNDRLFIEMIPRVRHVAHYGTPRDISNVAHAYARAKIWHYKLFVRLADRAVQLRSEYPCAHMTRLLESYAMVGMRYDKLFVEFSPRVQTIAHLLQPSELASVTASYAALHNEARPVFEVCATQATEKAASFSEDDARRLLDALSSVGFTNAETLKALGSLYPTLLEEFKSVAAEETKVDPESEGSEDGSPLVDPDASSGGS